MPTGILGVEMFVTVPRLMLMACLLSPSLSWALGLGEIHLNSSLNEPMNAEIDLIGAGQEELSALRATLAAKDSFTRYGIDRPPFLSTMTFKVGKSKDGRDVLLVRSTDAIPEPFVTFLVEVNWARGRLMREYTILLDPPVYTPGERASTAAPVAAATTAPTTAPTAPAPAAEAPARSRPAPVASPAKTAETTAAPAPSHPSRRSSGRSPAPSSEETASPAVGESSYRVAQGDTLTKIARSLHAETKADVDQTMIAVYRANPDAFGGNINILRRGAVLRLPGADEIAALNQTEAMSEVHRQMSAWRGTSAAAPAGHLRLVTPGAGGGTAASSDSASSGEAQALKGRVKDLEGQLSESQRLLEIKSNELSALQRKLGGPTTAAAAPPPPTVAPAPTAVKPEPAPPVSAPQPSPAQSTAPAPPAPAPVAVPKPAVAKKPAAAAESGSWLDWVAANWWLPAAVIVALIAGLAFASWRRRQGTGGGGDFPGLDSTDISDFRDPTELDAGNDSVFSFYSLWLGGCVMAFETRRG